MSDRTRPPGAARPTVSAALPDFAPRVALDREAVHRQLLDLELVVEPEWQEAVAAAATAGAEASVTEILRRLCTVPFGRGLLSGPDQTALTPFQLRRIGAARGDQLRLGGYVLRDRLGKGGMGEVFLAWELHPPRLVALKLLRNPGGDDDEWRQALAAMEREAELLANIEAPNLPAVYNIHIEGGVACIAMQYLRGQTLTARYRPPAPAEAAEDAGTVSIPAVPVAFIDTDRVRGATHHLRQVAEALQEAHEKGVVHRDIKPDNVMVTRKGSQAYLLDLGIAEIVRSGTVGATMQDNPRLVGTVQYMAPEQWTDSHVGPAADVYSLGLTYFYALTGRHLYGGLSLTQAMVAHRETMLAFGDEEQRLIPPAVRELVAEMTRKDAASRPADAAAVKARLLRLEQELTGSIPVQPWPLPDGAAPAADPGAATAGGDVAGTLHGTQADQTDSPSVRREAGRESTQRDPDGPTAPAGSAQRESTRRRSLPPPSRGLPAAPLVGAALLALAVALGLGVLVWSMVGLAGRPDPVARTDWQAEADGWLDEFLRVPDHAGRWTGRTELLAAVAAAPVTDQGGLDAFQAAVRAATAARRAPQPDGPREPDVATSPGPQGARATPEPPTDWQAESDRWLTAFLATGDNAEYWHDAAELRNSVGSQPVDGRERLERFREGATRHTHWRRDPFAEAYDDGDAAVAPVRRVLRMLLDATGGRPGEEVSLTVAEYMGDRRDVGEWLTAGDGYKLILQTHGASRHPVLAEVSPSGVIDLSCWPEPLDAPEDDRFRVATKYRETGTLTLLAAFVPDARFAEPQPGQQPITPSSGAMPCFGWRIVPQQRLAAAETAADADVVQEVGLDDLRQRMAPDTLEYVMQCLRGERARPAPAAAAGIDHRRRRMTVADP